MVLRRPGGRRRSRRRAPERVVSRGLRLVPRWGLPLLAALLVATACESITETEIQETGTIVFVDDELPCWLIETGATRYLPINLPAEFEEAGLRVRFEARRSAGTTVCGGFVIELLSIERL